MSLVGIASSMILYILSLVFKDKEKLLTNKIERTIIGQNIKLDKGKRNLLMRQLYHAHILFLLF